MVGHAPVYRSVARESKTEALKIIQEGERAFSEAIDCAMDISFNEFRQLAGAAVPRRQGWLKATSFRPEVQQRILDMPYYGIDLFGKHVDEALQNIKSDTDTEKSLAVLQQSRS